ncbi:MAG: polyribonucleotide nucleotidyltransferase [Candidatus Kerfeldbacteria bacterium RIFCSPHIGHO2_02_FULL_42_14]|uniref:Polyribonucleotide nucleotidyltransferase n=1 Tax=Candidatus Kerfeldbacteria bacterium RIFCSPHIGHO2_02_FULL_42_14 TaxID=1798540 RepID=A0A1G2ANG0_9BACT|nr:MAG: polyribonucleotide nucleotidyltransferase [Candidatus Kerfeldbacteria bacterium RIFCSPHIGHO2_02_FULL_42_14]OGY81790.1 MAG: polyribonucleotide nucleotidyltransferase [Candidatus Kerfeldbacteria bacterium RIFCSPHIGHO2_12_FULL_42_13]OGY84479.1 MAG: polyribonucleotide nucleotidyltransferase [Candidatus Kerfeldbacteria bacterium RIFCSPLOWO2_02_FULL_42_19]OGY87981.1 MAG: polyribonucleotide nucleotidyltransferase [Candidatus Kerfeldbacteria bacterium RIFCSPLOWO2_12_FULL_43_9]
MSEVHHFATDVGGKSLRLQIGKLAKQSNASVIAQYGDTMVLATAVMGKQPTSLSYFPLLVDYEERLYAAGKIKGSRFIKREGKPSDEAILSGRLIDRSLRPLFDQRLRREVQVVITILSIDKVNDPDFPAMIAASCALAISEIPWEGPIGAVALGYVDGNWIVNPSMEQKATAPLELFVSGKGSDVIMIEAKGHEVEEKLIEEGLKKSVEEIQKMTKFFKDIQNKIGKPKEMQLFTEGVTDEEKQQQKIIDAKLTKLLKDQYAVLMQSPNKEVRNRELQNIETTCVAQLQKELPEITETNIGYAKQEINAILELHATKYVIEKGVRIDERKASEIREISAEVSIIPRAHGSGLFTRGETQILSVATLGAPGDKQVLDEMEIEGEKSFMHHYNFPGFSVGEVKPMRGPGRREIGHGALAEKALLPVIPTDKSAFPYTIRLVSETLSSNGSSSQASICASSLALMDAGVPISAHVAGIAMGMMSDPKTGKHTLLTDIQGIEDHAGDMDFKIAGTRKGVTAIQLDIKLGGITLDVCKEALEGAKNARARILDLMESIIPAPRKELSIYAPRIESVRINPDKIREVIGAGGKTINKIIEETEVDIDIEDDGLVMITSTNAENLARAKAWIEEIVKEIEAGEIYEGKITQIIKDRNNGNDIGAIVQLTTMKDGMIHISEIAHERIRRITDVVNIGDQVRVKVLRVDHNTGRVELSRKELLENTQGTHDRPERRRPGLRGKMDRRSR